MRLYINVMIKISKNQSGATFIEMLVAVSIFAVMAISAVGIFQLVIEGERNVLASQNIQESLRYALEAMSKEIRNAQVDGGACSIPDSDIYKSLAGGTQLSFKNKYGECVNYHLDDDRIRIERGAQSGYITPSDIRVNSMKFVVNQSSSEQPSVTINIDAEVITKTMHAQEMKIQTTLVARYYE